MLQLFYTLALGLLCTIFIWVALATFYRRPEGPESVVWKEDSPDEKEVNAELQAKWQRENEIYHKVLEEYNTWCSVVLLVAASVLVGISLATATKIGVLSDGIMLGGVFTLMAGVGVGVTSGTRMIKFFVALASLIFALVIGYLKFLPH